MRKTILAVAVMGAMTATGFVASPAFAQAADDIPNAQGNPYPNAYRYGYQGYPAPGYHYPSYLAPTYSRPSYAYSSPSYYAPRPHYYAPRSYYGYSAPSYAYAPRSYAYAPYHCNPYDVARPGVNTACY
jgi:hypothetical protein